MTSNDFGSAFKSKGKTYFLPAQTFRAQPLSTHRRGPLGWIMLVAVVS